MNRLRAFWTPIRILDALLVLAVIYITVWELHPNLLVSSSLITGGDTGSHLALPAYLRSTNNVFNFTPWYPGWLDGIPAYTYYFVLPDVLATFASYVIGFAVAMKLATIVGSLLMPITAYSMGRLFRAPRPVPVALALATLPFLFDASFTIDGGNLFSTMAGEYAFSLSLALALLTIGLVARGVRTGRGYWLAAVSLSATLASHVLPWLFSLGAIAVVVVLELFARRGHGDPRDRDLPRGDFARPLRFASGAVLLSLGLSAWWLFPFATTQSLTDSLGYTKIVGLHADLMTIGWLNASGGAGGDRWVIVLAAVAVVGAVWVRDRLGMVLATLCVLSLAAFVLDPQSAIWNQRLIPFWFISIHLIAGWLVGYVAWRWAERTPARRRATVFYVPGDDIVYADARGEDVNVESAEDVVTVDLTSEPTRRGRRVYRATCVVALLGLLSTVPGLITPLAKDLHLNTGGDQVSVWSQYNYSGYQAKPGWAEYHDLIQTMAKVSARYGCGRAMWEYSFTQENLFGTPEALMLLPYWTNNCVDSEEGLLMESSPTTPYHYLDQSELSASPSDPQVGLQYGPLDVALGVRHLQMLGVKYYMAFSPSVIAQANADPELRFIAQTRDFPAPGARWRIYLVRHSPVVEALRHLPNVVANVASQSSWLLANQTWWLTPHLQGVLGAMSGPPSWPRAASITSMRTTTTLPSVTVSHVTVGLQTLSFHVSRIGVPMLVKISYYPRWHVTGAKGPFRVSPNLMVVVPTSRTVELDYTSTAALSAGNIVSDVTVIAGFVVAALAFRRRRTARR
jgi:hypothetical protein